MYFQAFQDLQESIVELVVQRQEAIELWVGGTVLNGTKAVVANCWHTPSKRRDCPLEDVVPLRGRDGQLAMSSRRDIATTRLRTPAASRYTATDLELPSLRLMLETSLGHCCICESPERPDLDITDPVLFLDFVASHTFCVPEDPASLFIDRLAGKWAIKNFSPARARSAATCRGSSRTRARRTRKFFKFSALPNFSANRGAATQ